MKAGTRQHAALEAEMGLAQVEVVTETKEDAFAVRLLNAAQNLQQLLEGGLTREMPIWGCIQVHCMLLCLHSHSWTRQD